MLEPTLAWNHLLRGLYPFSPIKKLTNALICAIGDVIPRYSILICIQQDATLHSLFYLGTALHVLGGTSTHHQERKQLYL